MLGVTRRTMDEDKETETMRRSAKFGIMGAILFGGLILTALGIFFAKAMPIGTGYVAKFICSSTFISQRDPDTVFRGRCRSGQSVGPSGLLRHRPHRQNREGIFVRHHLHHGPLSGGLRLFAGHRCDRSRDARPAPGAKRFHRDAALTPNGPCLAARKRWTDRSGRCRCRCRPPRTGNRRRFCRTRS